MDTRGTGSGVPASPRRRRRAPGIRGLVRARRARWLLVLLLAFPVAALLHRAGDAARGVPVETILPVGSLPEPGDETFLRSVAAATEVVLSSGNRIEVLLDQAVFSRILEDVRAARRSVTVFSYFCEPGRLGDEFATALGERARAGVQVFFLGDAFGCGDLVDELDRRLEGTGARVASLRPVRWWALHKAQHRNHGRTVVVDGEVGYAGGFGLADAWIGSRGMTPWRETSLRIEGPGAAALQGAFTAAWAEATGALPAGVPFAGEGRPPPEGEGVQAGLLVSRPGMGPTEAERFFALTLGSARHTLHIANSYFVPNRETRRQLVEAADRGVDVRVLVPGPVNDVPGTRWAGQHWFRELLEGGVRIWEYQGTMMHAKTLVADGVWSTVGSMNLDNRSLRLNEEWSVVIHDRALGARLDSLFLADLGRARERTLAMHLARPAWDRVREFIVSLLAPFF